MYVDTGRSVAAVNDIKFEDLMAMEEEEIRDLVMHSLAALVFKEERSMLAIVDELRDDLLQTMKEHGAKLN